MKRMSGVAWKYVAGATLALNIQIAEAAIMGDSRFNCNYPTLATLGPGSNSINQSCFANLPLFDGTLGELNSVKVSILGNLRHGVYLGNPTNSSQTVEVDVVLDWGVKLSAPPFPSVATYSSTDPLNTISGTVAVAPTGSNFTGVGLDSIYLILTPGNNPIELIFTGADMASFVGVGTFSIEQFANADITIAATSEDILVKYQVGSTGSGRYSVVYDYVPVTGNDGTGSGVPEPATLALLSLGLAGLGLSRCRRT